MTAWFDLVPYPGTWVCATHTNTDAKVSETAWWFVLRPPIAILQSWCTGSSQLFMPSAVCTVSRIETTARELVRQAHPRQSVSN